MPPPRLTLYEETALRGGLDPALTDFSLPRPAAPRTEPTIPPLSPEEESSLLARIGGAATSGLAWLGGSLGKAFGGRAIRGLLGGNLRELASVIPFSDTLGITDPSQEVRGAELLGNKEADLLSPEGIGGLGLDILLDPGTYLTFGGSALTPLGKAARQAGVLPKTLLGRTQGLAAGAPELGALASATGRSPAELAGQALGGVAGLRIPFTEPTAVLGTGPVGQKLAGLIDTGLDKLKYSAPVRYLSSLFDPTVGGATTAIGQRAGRAASEAFTAGQAAARTKQLEVLRILQEHDALGSGQLLRQAVEQPGSLYGPFAPGVEQGVTEAAAAVRGHLDEMLRLERSLGIPTKALLDETVNYFPRYRTVLEQDTRGFSSGARQGLPTGHPSLVGREEILRDFPGGTAGVNLLAADPELKALVGTPTLTPGAAAPKPLVAAQKIRERYLGMSAADEAEMFGLANRLSSSTNPLTEAEKAAYDALKSKWDQANRLTDWVRGLDPQYAEKGLEYFGNNPATDFLTRALHHERAVSGAGAIHEMLAATAEPAGAAAAGAVPLRQALTEAGFAEGGSVTQGAVQALQQRLSARGVTAGLDDLYVPAQVAKDASRYVKAVTTPEGLEPFLKVYDQVTNLTKTMQTTLWPAFHTRNFVTGLWMNWVTGSGDPRYPFSPMAYLKPLQEAVALRSGVTALEGANGIKGLTHLSAEDATRALQDEIYVHNVTGHKVFADVTGQGQHVAQQAAPRLPGQAQPTFGELLSGAIPRSGREWNPLNVAGVGANVDLFAPAAAGRRIGEASDDLNRVAAYLAKRRQGLEPAVAAAEVKATHFDYSALTPFERSTMRRVVPFYNWLSNNVPFAVSQLAAEPGGRYAMALRAAGEARGAEPGFLPPYLGEGVALPIGGPAEDGTRRFLSHTGLPFEDLAQEVNVRGYLGALNPLIKAPLELATNRQFFSGRDLTDLYTMTGNTVGDQLLMNSPLGRFVTAGRTLADERKDLLAKAVNLGTGVHVTDVDMGKARDIAVRELIDEATRGDRNVGRFERLYVRPENLANLSPQELLLLRLNATREAAHRQAALAGR
jgi:hypothetical protein